MELAKNIGSFKQTYMLDYGKSEMYDFDANLGFAYGYEKITPISLETNKCIEEQVSVYIYPHLLNMNVHELFNALEQKFIESYNTIISLNTDFKISATPPKNWISINENRFYYVYNIGFRLEKSTELKETYLWIFIYDENFIKIRYTSDKYNQESINEILKYFSKYMSADRKKLYKNQTI